MLVLWNANPKVGIKNDVYGLTSLEPKCFAKMDAKIIKRKGRYLLEIRVLIAQRCIIKWNKAYMI